MGHSTLPIDEFIARLKALGITIVLDIRTVPRSRHNPQFEQQALAASLEKVGIRYRHIKDLGGLRKPSPDSPNRGWRNTSFRGYADHMQTPAFRKALERVIRLSQKQTPVLLCAEAVPWRCHRSLVADALLARGLSVADVGAGARPRPHRLNPMARVLGTQMTYPEAITTESTSKRASSF